MRWIALFSAALLLSGCPGNQRGEDVSQNPPPKTSTTTANPQAVPERSGKMNPITPPNTEVPAASPLIQVQLLEYEIRMPDTIPAGVHTFYIANAGKQPHSFAIEGNGLSHKLAMDLSRGNTTTLSIDLKAGTYTIFCPVDRHRGRGMERTLTVR